MSFIEKLKEKQGKRSQLDFAADLHIDQSILSRLLRGERRKSWRILANIFAKYPSLLQIFITDYSDVVQGTEEELD